MGPEAPLVQSTGTVGTWVGTRMGRDRPDVRILTITGMAAGFTVLFGAPLGSALFALEILHRRGLQYYEALLPAVVGSLCGYGVYIALSGAGIEPVWSFGTVGTLHGGDLATAAAVGVAGAIGAAIFTLLVTAVRRVLRPIPRSGRYVLGGLLLGLLGLWSPYALTFGEDQLGGLLDVRLAAGALAVALLAKLAGTTITLASGWKGGFIIPLFFMGATLGQLVHHALPGTNDLRSPRAVASCVLGLDGAYGAGETALRGELEARGRRLEMAFDGLDEDWNWPELTLTLITVGVLASSFNYMSILRNTLTIFPLFVIGGGILARRREWFTAMVLTLSGVWMVGTTMLFTLSKWAG